MRNSKVFRLIIMALLISIDIILTRFLSLETPIVRIGFSFLPIAIMGILYNPLYAGVGAAIGDFLGVVLFGKAAFFPGFTFSAFLTAVVYSVFMYNKPKKLWRLIVSSAIIKIFIDLLLNTYWLYILTGKAYLALLPFRITEVIILFFVSIIIIWIVAYRTINIHFASEQHSK